MADETQLDEGYAPTPAGIAPPDVDLELDLQDQAASRDGLIYEEPPVPPLGRSPAYDYIAQSFVPSAAGGPQMIYGLDTLASWLEKCTKTVQGDNPAVDPSFGLAVSLESLLLSGEPVDESVVAEVEDVIVEAFKVHPRVPDVLDFELDFDPDDDRVYLSYTIPVGGEEDDEEPLTVENLPVLLGGSP